MSPPWSSLWGAALARHMAAAEPQGADGPAEALATALQLAALLAEGRMTRAAAATLLRRLGAIEPCRPGQILNGRFVILGLLGRGSCASVFAARDQRREEAGEPETQVALKLLNLPLLTEPGARSALFREARLAARLTHPNIVQVRDYDEADGLPFIVMEPVFGHPLNRLIGDQGQGLGWSAARPLLAQLAAALGHAHDRRVVHGDIKPGNVLLTPAGEIKLLDFGAARGLGPAGPRAAFDGFTPSFATRELAAGAPPEPADDLHALAVLAHRLAGGQRGPEGQALPPPEIPRRAWLALRAALKPQRDAAPADAADFLRRILR